MAVAQALPRLGQLEFRDFSGGLNTRDHALEVAPNQLSAGLNVVILEGGRVLAKRGAAGSLSTLTAAPATPVTPTSNLFYSKALDLWFFQVDNAVYKSASSGAWTNILTPGDATGVGFADFNGEVVMCNRTGGVWTYDGTTVTNRSVIAKGGAIAVWQNKVWIAKGDRPPRLWYSNAGDAHTWTTATDWVDLREKNDDPIQALFGASGLIVTKRNVTYRVNDSTTGAYQTIDWNVGSGAAVNSYTDPGTLCGLNDGSILALSKDGLFRGNGIGPWKKVSRLVPELNAFQAGGFSSKMIPFGSKVLILQAGGQGAAQRLYEYDIELGFILRHELGGNPNIYGMAEVVGFPIIASLAAGGFSPILSTFFDPANNTSTSDGTGTFASSARGGFVPLNAQRYARVLRMQARGRFSNGAPSPAWGIATVDDSGAVAVRSSVFPASSASDVVTPLNCYLLGRSFAWDVDTSGGQAGFWRIADMEMQFVPVET